MTSASPGTTLLGLYPSLPVLFSILTLFPEAIESYQDVGILGIARARGLLTTRTVNFRDFARDRHRTVDDRPFGGGPGMVLKPEPITEAIEWIEQRFGPHRRIALTPDGAPLSQGMVEEFVVPPEGGAEPRPVLLLCGRYEGFDERILELHKFERLSIGDYVLAGGELPALVLLESVSRLIPGGPRRRPLRPRRLLHGRCRRRTRSPPLHAAARVPGPGSPGGPARRGPLEDLGLAPSSA